MVEFTAPEFAVLVGGTAISEPVFRVHDHGVLVESGIFSPPLSHGVEFESFPP